MYEIKVHSDFCAAHRIRGYRGKCEELHGHNWKVELKLKKAKLNKLGMVADFKQIKKDLSGVLRSLDHRSLNTLAYFKRVNPTSENIAKYIYGKLNSKFKIKDISFSVCVWESDSASAAYNEE